MPLHEVCRLRVIRRPRYMVCLTSSWCQLHCKERKKAFCYGYCSEVCLSLFFFLPFSPTWDIVCLQLQFAIQFYIRGSIVYIRHCKSGVMFCLWCTLPTKKLPWNPRVVFMCKTKLDEMRWDGQHDRCKVQSHYTPNKGWQKKPICTRTCSTVPLLQQLAVKTTLSFCNDWFSWFSPSSNKQVD
jgi:hypothetical protein